MVNQYQQDMIPGMESFADPLYFQVQRGEATQQEYDDLIAQIRADLPYAQEAGGS